MVFVLRFALEFVGLEYVLLVLFVVRGYLTTKVIQGEGWQLQ